MKKYQAYYVLLIIMWFVLIIGFAPFSNIYYESLFMSTTLYIVGSFLEKEKHPMFKNFKTTLASKTFFILGAIIFVIAALICWRRNYDFHALALDKEMHKTFRYFPSASLSSLFVGVLIVIGRYFGANTEGKSA